MSLINILNLTFSYDGSYDNIFENVSFQIDTDWKLGFTGRNGRGKTTFLHLLMGDYECKGTITSSVQFDYFPYQVSDKTQNTINIVESVCPQYEIWKLNKELNFLQVTQDVLYRPFNTLSNGEQTKVLLACLFLKNDNFLLIDEPTNHLDMFSRQIVSNYLKSKQGFILVSHDRAFLDNCIDHVLSINKTNVEIQKGNFSSWLQNKKFQDDFELAENDKLKREISRLQKTASQKKEWSNRSEKNKIGFNPVKAEKSIGTRSYEGMKSKKMMKRAKIIESRCHSAIEDKSKLLKNIETSESLKISPLNYHSKQLIEAKDLSIFYDTKCVSNHINFEMNSGERIALIGKNGCGKSSILKLIMGNEINYQGTLNIGSKLIISYISQDTSFLSGNLKDYVKKNNLNESLFKAILRKLDFSRIQFEKDLDEFSGGQKKKVLIAKSLCEQAHVYIWDEPLNFIDVISRIQIEDLILQYQPTMLFVEHDKSFVESISTKQVYL